MNKNRNEKGMFVKTDYSKFIGKQYGNCKVLDVYYIAKRKVAKIKCVSCGKEKVINASYIDNKRFNSCRCLGNQQEEHSKLTQDLWKEKRLLSSNTSGYTGVYHITVSHHRAVDFYRACVVKDGHSYFIGEFKNKMDAVAARRAFIKKKGWIEDE